MKSCDSEVFFVEIPMDQNSANATIPLQASRGIPPDPAASRRISLDPAGSRWFPREAAGLHEFYNSVP